MDVTLPGEVRDFTRHIVECCDLYSASIFLCDRTGAKPRMSHLFHHNIVSELRERYEGHAIFHDDPFTHPAIQEREDLIDFDGLLSAGDQRVRSGATAPRYWQFMYDHDVDVVGASTRRLLPGLYATIGYHRRRTARPRAEVATERLDVMTRQLQDMVGGRMLHHLLHCANGLSTFRVGYFERTETASSPRLTPRESEIATLVCAGKQNKEIAYLTGLAEHSVENHLRRIYAKLSIHNRSALVAAMTRAGPVGCH